MDFLNKYMKDDKKKSCEKNTIESKYQLLKVIGKGTFAVVRLASKGEEDTKYAIKIVDKLYVLQQNHLENIKNEKKILMTLTHPFVISIKETFQDPRNVYFVMDYVPGGELFRLIAEQKRLPNDVALFYACEVIEIITFLHQNGIIYRDLKPENILITGEGHIKLVDFGYAKELSSGQRANSFVGTLTYLAPEILARIQSYTFAVDYWAIGILIFEMLTGITPFDYNEPQAVYDAILKGKIKYPERMNKHAQDLISKLLTVSENDRLGSKDLGQSIKKHPWFKGIDWKTVADGKFKPPWIPKLKSEADTQYFQEYPGVSENTTGRILEKEFQDMFEGI